jgi:hypothetical protein
MSLENFLEERKSAILERWFDLIVETYPTDTRRFLQKQKNRFANPVAHEISLGIEEIFNNILKGGNPEDVSPFLDKIIRIRAVQEFTPSQALGFIFELKKLIREELAENIGESRQCREKLYQMRVKEVKNRVGRLIERANMMCGIPEKEGDPEVCNTDNLT